jgi:predicted lipoprotein with Yx(FWY)xxD motif
MVLVAAGCGASGGSPSASGPAPEASAPAPEASAPAPEASAPAASEAAGEEYEINVATDPTLGDILVGEDGKTLYVFTKDTGGNSACNDDCATTWPPFALEEDEEVVAGDGVTGVLATIARDDGSLQITYAGAPLYYFANDAAAGDVNGQGINDVWFVATPSGTSGPSGSSGTGGDEYSRGGSNPTATP